MLVLNKYKDSIPDGATNIMRPSIWGNPYTLQNGMSREEVLERYEEYLNGKLKEPSFLHALKQLVKSPALVCCCKPKICHGDILVKKMKALNLID